MKLRVIVTGTLFMVVLMWAYFRNVDKLKGDLSGQFSSSECAKACWHSIESAITKGEDIQDEFFSAFHNPGCSNPCWLGIEVGETDQATVISILEENEIDYGIPGVIHLYSLPHGSVPGMQEQEITPASIQGLPVFGDINVGQESDDIVQSLDFWIDLCVITFIEVYGNPDVWSSRDDIPTLLVYPDYQMFLSVEPETLRINWISLHIKENIPSPDELDNWSLYAGLFSSECVDEFIKLES